MTSTTERSAGLGRPFWVTWTASTVSNLGDGIHYAAVPLLAASLTRDPRLIAMVGVASYVPAVLMGLPSGAVVDRADRRRLMWRIDLLRTVVVGAFATLVVLGEVHLATLLVMLFVLSGGGIFFDNAASAIMPMLVDGPRLERANAWLMGGQVVTSQFVGLPLGGLLFTAAASLPFIVDSTTFLVAAGLVGLGMTGGYSARRQGQAPTRMRADVAEGLRWLWRHRVLRAMALLLATVNGAFAAGEAVLVLYALEVLDVGKIGYTLLLTALAVGSLVGGSVASRLRARFGVGPLVTVVAGISAAGVVLAGGTSSTLVCVAGLVIVGATGMVWNVVTVSFRQSVVPAHLLGRVTSAYRVIGLGAMPAGAAVGGVLAGAFGLHAPYVVSGLALLAATAVSIPRLWRADDLVRQPARQG